MPAVGFLGTGLVAAPSPWRLCPCDHLGGSCRQQGSTQSHALVKSLVAFAWF
jgi:hypothetical protein